MMNREKLDVKLLEDAHVLLHPTRYRIVELLAEKPMHIDALATALGMEKRLVSYHLLKLEEHGFVTREYELGFVIKQKGKGKAFRVYMVTDKVAEVKAELKNGALNKTYNTLLRL